MSKLLLWDIRKYRACEPEKTVLYFIKGQGKKKFRHYDSQIGDSSVLSIAVDAEKKINFITVCNMKYFALKYRVNYLTVMSKPLCC